MPSPSPTPLEFLTEQAKRLESDFKWLHRSAFYCHNASLVLALVATVVAAWYVVGGRFPCAAYAAVVAAAIVATDKIWSAGERAQFWRVVRAMARNLLADIEMISGDQERLLAAHAAYKQLELYAAEKVVQGAGMAAVVQLGADLERLKTDLKKDGGSRSPAISGSRALHGGIRIDIVDGDSRLAWAKTLQVDEAKLGKAVKEAGDRLGEVEKWLKAN